MGWPSTVEKIDGLALRVYQDGLGLAWANIWVISGRVDRACAADGDDVPPSPKQVSQACQRLIRLGWAEASPLGYRRREAQQGVLGGD